MKKIFQLTTLVAMALVVFSCTKKEVSTEQFDTTAVVLKAYGPQPVVRGGILRFVGSNLDKVASVTIPGVAPLTPEVVTAGVHSEIRVTVPKDGPELGYPVLTLADGSTITAKTQLTYSEPILFESFSPTEVLPGTTITIKGDYLNLIHEVILPGDVYIPDDLFVAHDRYTIKVTVPETARTGKIGLGTLDESEVEDDKVLATLNVVESEEDLVVLTAEGALTAKSYKAGDAVTIKGTNLTLTKKVELEGADVTEFAATATTLTFVLPDTATDGEVLMVMASEVAVLAGEITTVVPVVSGVTPAPVKNGAVVTLAGSDLDLVTGLDFPNAAGAEFAFAEGLITATVPEAAQEGDITLHLANGKTVTADLTLVKPVVTAFSANPASAGSDVTITGTDLDLVAKVAFPGADAIEVEATETAITVAVPTAAETGKLVFTLKSGATVEVETELAIDKPAGAYIAVFPEEMYAPGAVFIVDIENADKLTGVQIDGADVTYILSGSTLYVSIPDNAKRGSQITLLSAEGNVTYTMNIDPGDIIETTLWSGSLEIAGWANNEMKPNDIFVGIEMKEGQTVRFYGDFSDWWCLQFFDGHWGEMTTGFNDEKHHMVSARVVPEAKEQGFFALTLTEDLITKLQTYVDWGYWGVIQGEGLTLTKITYYEDNSDGTEIWTGPLQITWSDGGRVALPTAAFQVAKAGQKLRLFYTQVQDQWDQAQVNDANWAVLDLSASGLVNPIVPTDIYGWFEDGILDRCTEITLTAELLEHLTTNTTEYEGVVCSIIIQGSGLTFNKVTIK